MPNESIPIPANRVGAWLSTYDDTIGARIKAVNGIYRHPDPAGPALGRPAEAGNPVKLAMLAAPAIHQT
ncbi:MAG: hypothetical protein A2W25_03290 [candidate division Zixibacteria bacterium RBG_16_53_22]|nr:MAG: hypothetical protein A2W25_03290 [candidate division Zixibacteria bacterium RBG_16_53_22]